MVSSVNQMYNGLKVLAVALRKGGVGKTLFSVLNAQYFGSISPNPKRVLLLDLDTQQNASETLLEMEVDSVVTDHKLPPIHPDYDPTDPDQAEWDGRSSTADIFYDTGIIAPYPTQYPGLEVLPAAGEALQAVEMVRSEEVKAQIYDRLKKFFEDPDVQANYDLIIIDTPPGKGAINRSVLRAATHVLYPVIPEEKPMEGLRGMIQFERMENRHRETPIQVVGVVPNKVNISTNVHNQNMKVLREDKDIGKYVTDFYVGSRIAFPAVDSPEAVPNNIWKSTKHPDARNDAYHLCEYVESELFGDLSEIKEHERDIAQEA